MEQDNSTLSKLGHVEHLLLVEAETGTILGVGVCPCCADYFAVTFVPRIFEQIVRTFMEWQKRDLDLLLESLTLNLI